MQTQVSEKSGVGAAPSAPVAPPRRRTMPRLKGFDYRRPYFYMVTLKRLPGLAPFSRIADDPDPPKDARGRPRYLIANDTTRAFARVIRNFAARWRGLAPIETFIAMPDHLHLLLKLEDTGDQLPLGSYVHQLMRALAVEYWRTAGRGAQNSPRGGTGPAAQYSDRSVVLPALSGNSDRSVVLPALSGNGEGPALSAPAPLAPVFAPDWHDWIVKKDGQLAGFTRYIRENPERAWLRKRNARFFGMVRKVSFLGREWFAYGNLAILDLPMLVAVKGHRATKQGSPEWVAMVEACERIGPGGAGVGTFMSPLEKECGNAIARAGGKWVVLSPEGFHARWHPPREKERFCAEGRMLFLSPYEPLDRLPTKAELYRRCHEMGAAAVAGLPAVERGGTGPAAQYSPRGGTGPAAQYSPRGATGRPAQYSDRSVVLPALSGNGEKPTLSGNREKPHTTSLTMKTISLFAGLLVSAAAMAEPLFDLDPYSIAAVSPGAYRTFGDAICAATNAPGSPSLSIRARVRPERCDSPQTGSLGIAAYASPDDYWQLALIKSANVGKNAGRRNFELKAMADGVWGGEKNIARRIRHKQSAQWEYGREYDLALSCTPELVEGEIRDAESGEVVFRASFVPGAPAPGRASPRETPPWRPALRAGGWFEGAIGAVEAEAGAPATGRAGLCETPYIPSGPDTGLRGTATGFFHIETIDGRDWPIDPTGRAVILAGTQHIKPWGTFSDAVGYSPYGRFVATNYPSVEAWADETLARLDDWGFTMLGNACALSLLAHKTLPHVQNLRMGQRVSRGDPDWYIREFGFKPCTALPNVFHPDFAAACEWRARELCAPFKDDPWLVGWFIDNELAWWGSSKRIRNTGVYGLVAKLPKSHSARKALDAFLAERGAAVPAGNGENGEAAAGGRVGLRPPSLEDKIAFLRLYARTYYEKTTAAIRKADPNHMVLGSRYAGIDGAAPVVWEEAGRFCDIVTFNCYPWADLDRGIVLDAEGGVPMTERLREYHGYANAPLMITEWSFPALDNGHPCLVGAGQRLRTQAERVEATMLFAKTLLADPHVAGYDYFKWNDQPKTGSSRFAPEDCNYGLVNDDGVPYEGITGAFKALHGDLVKWRSAPPPEDRGADAARTAGSSERERYFAEGGAMQPSGLSPAAFSREPDGAWSLSNGLLRISGRVGSKWLADEVAFADGRPVGRLNILLAAEEGDRYLWLDTTRLAGVECERDEATGAVSVLLRGLGGRTAAGSVPGAEAPGDASPPETSADTTLSFALTLRVMLLPGRPDALLEVAALENLSDAPLLASAVYLRAFSRDRQTTRPTSAPNVWKAPKVGTWSLPGGGEWGLVSHDSSIRKFRFFVTPNGVQHPDAAFSVVPEGETFPVAPGETWRPPVPMGARLFLTFDRHQR